MSDKKINENTSELGGMSDLDKKIEALVEARIAAILNERESTKQNASSKNVKKDDSLEEYVEVELFWDGVKYKDPVFVQLNGANCVIQRGVPVKIKRKFYQVLEDSKLQETHTAKLKTKAQAEAKALANVNII